MQSPFTEVAGDQCICTYAEKEEVEIKNHYEYVDRDSVVTPTFISRDD